MIGSIDSWIARSGARAFALLERRGTMRRLCIERLEPRDLLSVQGEWASAIFDNGKIGSLGFQVARDSASVDVRGELVAANEARYGNEQLLFEINPWTEVMSVTAGDDLAGSGWDHDGQAPLALLYDNGFHTLKFIQGFDYEVVNSVSIDANDGDLMQGQVAGKRYVPQHAIVYEGLVVFQTQRERMDGNSWIPEGVSFVYTQDYGASFHRVAQQGGGFDVPAIAGGVADGIDSGRSWSFSNAFPETSDGNLLGAWFPWADYLSKAGSPKGGQIGLFRARRPQVGQPWVVEPNVLVYETWEVEDGGGHHAHSAGMFVDGMASFWGDSGFRNRMIRHVAEDLENYTTTAWTHNDEFQGAWSPDDARVYSHGNQAASTAPAQTFGEILTTGDQQPELIMKVGRPEDPQGKAIVTSLRGSFLGSPIPNSLATRVSLWIHHLPDVGYVVYETNSQLVNVDAIYFSPDGEIWGSLLSLGEKQPYLYGNKVLVVNERGLHAADIPSVINSQAPLLVNPGGTNLIASQWTEVSPPAPGNDFRRVDYVDGEYRYADTGELLPDQPSVAPPIAPGMPLWEIVGDGVDRSLGDWEAAVAATAGDRMHWFTSWHYSLDGNGVAPHVQLGSDTEGANQLVWVANQQWVPAQTFGMPNPGDPTPENHPLRLSNGLQAAPRRWLMAVEGYSEGNAPTYPLPPAATGSDELAEVIAGGGVTTWTVGLTFGFPDNSSFSSIFDPLGNGTTHHIASLWENDRDYINITFTRTFDTTGIVALEVTSRDLVLDRIAFPDIAFDREDQVRLLVSSDPQAFGATLFLTRDGQGAVSKTIEGTSAATGLKRIRFSDALQTEVSPTEWYSVQVNDSRALTDVEREEFITSGYMVSNLDEAPMAAATESDFDQDGDVDGDDFLAWQRSFEMVVRADLEDGDSDADNDVDAVDLANWQSQYSPRLSGDFDLNLTVGGDDFLTWQRGHGTPTGAEFTDGDADEDGDVDSDDLAIWQAAYSQSRTAPAAATGDDPETAAALAANAFDDGSGTDGSQPRTAAASTMTTHRTRAVDVVLTQIDDADVPRALKLQRLAPTGVRAAGGIDHDLDHRPLAQRHPTPVALVVEGPILGRAEHKSRSHPGRQADSAHDRVFSDVEGESWLDAVVGPAAYAIDDQLKALL